MNELAVVILTKGDRATWLQHCLESVEAALPKTAQLYVFECKTLQDFFEKRVSSLSLAKYVCFIDDDDLVINDSLNKALKAIKKYNVGVVFTDEKKIDLSGNEIHIKPIRTSISYLDLTYSPETAHHICVLNTEFIQNKAIDFVQKSKCYSAIDWLLIASTAIVGKAVHIPIYGYMWRIHNGNLHADQVRVFGKHALACTLYLKSLLTNRELIQRI